LLTHDLVAAVQPPSPATVPVQCSSRAAGAPAPRLDPESSRPLFAPDRPLHCPLDAPANPHSRRRQSPALQLQITTRLPHIGQCLLICPVASDARHPAPQSRCSQTPAGRDFRLPSPYYCYDALVLVLHRMDAFSITDRSLIWDPFDETCLCPS